MSQLKRTPLYENHVKAGAKIVDFAGFAMPVQYTGIIEEHNTVRNQAGLFDVSHMGEIEIKGKDAGKFIQKLITNNLEKIEPEKVLYSPVCYEDGGTVDDLLVYCHNWEHFWLVVNASNTEKDLDWFNKRLKDEQVTIENISDNIALLALQGPRAQEILQLLTTFDLNEIRPFRFKSIDIAGVDCLVSRTGYTGEDGFEIYLASDKACFIWETLLEKGKGYGLAPIGLGARDTLRFEAGLPLYGHELSPEITPLEAGLGFFVDLKSEHDFIGRKALEEQRAQGIPRKKVGLEMLERGIPREGYPVQKDGKEIGYITSGSPSPTLGKHLGMALIQSSEAEIGNEVEVIIRNRAVKAQIIKTPFYKKEDK